MHTQQTIAVIGAEGAPGAAISQSLAQSGFRLLLVDRSLEVGQQLAARIADAVTGANITLVACERDACWEADIVILALPVAAAIEAVGKVGMVANQKVVIDLTGLAAAEAIVAEAGNDTGARLQQLLPFAHLVQTVAHVNGKEEKPALSLAATQEEALQTAAALLQQAGYQTSITNRNEQNI